MRLLAFLVLVSSTLVSCGPSSTESATQRTIDDFSVLGDASALQSSGTQISGNGRVVGKTVLGGTADAGASYALRFTVSDGGSVKLYSHANSDLLQGVTFTFARSGSTLTTTVLAGGNSTSPLSQLSSVSASGEIALQIDVHNGEGEEGHYLVWSGSDFTAGAALLNSEATDGSAFTSPGKGSGTYWGLEVANATVTRLNVSAPKLVE